MSWPGATGALAAAATVLAAAACSGGAEPEPSGEPATTAPPATETGAEPEAAALDGEELYVRVGCNSCHGPAGEGTEIGPALPGHAPEQIRRQVRAPLAEMPSYTEEQLGDDELEAIVEYLTGLAPAEEHMEPVELDDVLAMHHWMALSAIQEGDEDDAVHHMEHVIAAVRGEHRRSMQRALRDLEAGRPHDAEHAVEAMLEGIAEPALRLRELHLQIALGALEARDRAEAIHHTRHFVQLSRGAPRREGREILGHLRAGDLHDAQHGMQALLGQQHD